jgi:arylsulfatase A-like enzyme
LQPDVTVCWLTDPDHTQHRYGLGAPRSVQALRECDATFGQLQDSLDALGWREQTNIIVTSDHGFSTRSGWPEGGAVPALVEAGLKESAESADVIVSGGAVYLAAAARNRAPAIVKRLQEHPRIGSILVADDGPAAGCPGTLPLSAAWAGSLHRRRPDIQFSPIWWNARNEWGVPGFVAGSDGAGHGSTSPRDLHNTLVLAGPDVKRRQESDLPAGLIDLAPTILAMLGLPVPEAMDGRVLTEVLVAAPSGPGPDLEGEPHEERLSAQTALPSGGAYQQWLRRVQVGRTWYLTGAGAERG